MSAGKKFLHTIRSWPVETRRLAAWVCFIAATGFLFVAWGWFASSNLITLSGAPAPISGNTTPTSQAPRVLSPLEGLWQSAGTLTAGVYPRPWWLFSSIFDTASALAELPGRAILYFFE